jgi:hypothetical protein
MNDADFPRPPAAIAAIVRDTERLSFIMISEARVDALLAVLAASKPGGRLLELVKAAGRRANVNGMNTRRCRVVAWTIRG